MSPFAGHLPATLPRCLLTNLIEKGNNSLMTSSSKSPRRRSAKIAAGLALAAALTGGVAACGSSGGSSISLVAYSPPGPAYTGKLIPAFQKTSQGKGTSFTTSFGASGDQSRAVESGQSADVVHFSILTDMERLVDD